MITIGGKMPQNSEMSPVEKKPLELDPYSLLNAQGQEELNNLDRKNTVDGLTPPEVERRDFLRQKQRGEFLEPLTGKEYQQMIDLQKMQTASNNWSGEDADKLYFLQWRFKGKGRIESHQQAAQ